MRLDIFSFGGGVQSTAALVMAARGDIDCKKFVFANVGDDSESPDTLAYLRNHHIGFAKAHGISLVEVAKKPTLLDHARSSKSTIAIPMRMANGAPGNRTCTQRWKIEPIARYLKKIGFTKDAPATMGMGISIDEWQRVRTDSGFDHIKKVYPLVDMKITREECRRIISSAGLPPAPKSSCWFCPYHSLSDWRQMRRDRPDRFAAAAALEVEMQEKRKSLGKDDVYLCSRAKNLEEAIEDDGNLFSDDMCESGFCMT